MAGLKFNTGKMSMRNILSVLFFIAITGCSEQIQEIGKKVAGDSPEIYLGSGIELQISESETATVFGYDDCPESNIWLFEKHPHSNKCVKLTGNKSVDVRLIHSDGSVSKEKWSVSGDANKISLIRPNGFQIREPELSDNT